MKTKPEYILSVAAVKIYQGQTFECSKRLRRGVQEKSDRVYQEALVNAMDDVIECVDYQEMSQRK